MTLSRCGGEELGVSLCEKSPADVRYPETDGYLVSGILLNLIIMWMCSDL